ncbi:Alpha-1,3-mannosyltransferase-like protein [Recurvomyces mirabilis]|uniref:Alpha-1,3/1,6-mannosyltransferase ALG2 n=1 Tax=Recurvomyces mirabilis TaxID=574656 RepID=A0AAE0WTY1_9PEZI|nr:Alpha-1,3-mannosyltransferase-like protein [Recurvomyces mirabilis]KAK5160670.1 Alpha-1,3-mannosyltransferase-like protein [Recurvomyces mirabilis]
MANTSTPTSAAKNIVFVHPDLGIGGAERLVIDAAVGLQSLGHKVTVLTSYRDTNHCFEEARDGTLDVRVRGDALFPPSIGGRLSILFSILRQLALVVSTGVASNELKTLQPDVIFVDQLSACVPLLRLLYPQAKVLFYGHYPDRLLAQEADGVVKYIKRAYRLPFDAIEGWSTGCSDDIVVNSRFTRGVFKATFRHMQRRDMKVIYPCVDTSNSSPKNTTAIWPGKRILLSINRFEGKKNLDLAIRAYAGLSADERKRSKLIMAGGFDPRAPENAVVHKRLQQLSESLHLTHATFRSNDTLTTDLTTDDVDTLFLLSIPHEMKQRLLNSASLLIYTPKNEHFGIVPLEAMLAGAPVLATNTGGPLETIYDGRTGWLRSPDRVEQWTEVMRKALIPSSEDALRAMGQKGRERVLAEFSHTKMTASLDKEIQDLCASTALRPAITPEWVQALLVVTLIAIIAGFLVSRFFLWAVNLDEQKHLRDLASAGSGIQSTIASVAASATHVTDEL